MIGFGPEVPRWIEVALERCPSLLDVEREWRRMKAEIKQAEIENTSLLSNWWKWGQRGEARKRMEYLVDAGVIAKVKAVTERDAVQLTLALAGDQARYPIDVYTPATGEKVTFVETAAADVPPKKPPQPETKVRSGRKKA